MQSICTLLPFCAEGVKDTVVKYKKLTREGDTNPTEKRFGAGLEKPEFPAA